MTLGRYAIPDVSVWAFEGRVGETSPVIEAAPAYYVFRLDSLAPAGTPPLADIREPRRERGPVGQEASGGGAPRRPRSRRPSATRASLLETGPAHGLSVQKIGPFPRLAPPAFIRPDPLVVGAAFGLKPGTRSGVIKSQTGFYFVEALSHSHPDSAAWAGQKDQQREGLMQIARQARVQAYVAALRERAKIVDRRKELFTRRRRRAAASRPSPTSVDQPLRPPRRHAVDSGHRR